MRPAQAIAAILATVPSSNRWSVANAALRQVPSDQKPNLALVSAFPDFKDTEDAYDMLQGAGLLTTALGKASPTATVDEVTQYASSLAKGVPVAGDPVDGEDTNGSVPIAAALIDIQTENPEVAEAIASDPEVLDYAKKLLSDYDCHRHKYILGGAPFDNGKRKKGCRLKTRSLSGSPFAGNFGDWLMKNVVNPALGIDDGSTLEDTDVSTWLDDSKLTALRENMTTAMSAAQEASTTAKEAGRNAARMAWAMAFLKAPDNVVDIMEGVNPSTDTAKDLLSTALGLVSYARETGDVSYLTALKSAVSAASKSSASEGSVAQILQNGLASYNL